MRDLDPKRVLADPDMQITGAALQEGAVLHVGQLGTFAVDFNLLRSMDRLAIALRVYDSDGRCAFASGLQDHGVLLEGSHQAVIYVLLTLPVGSYAASFEFVESSVLDGNPVRCSLGLNNLFVAFALKNDLILPPATDGDLEAGYARLPTRSLVMDQLAPSLACATDVVPGVATPYFPWPLVSFQFSQDELADVLRRALFPEFPFIAQTGADPQAVFTPRSPTRYLAAGLFPMLTQAGVVQAKGVHSHGVAGCLVFGPYLPVMPGRYRVTFNGEVGPAGAAGLKLDLSARRGSLLLGGLESPCPVPGPLAITYEFAVPAPGYVDLEFRLWGEATDDVYVENIEITSLADTSTENIKVFDTWLQAFVVSAHRLDWMLQQPQLGMVYCPSLGWSPLILALCEQLPQQGLSWVLVVPDDLDTATLPLSLSAVQKRVIRLSEALALPKMVKCTMVVTHSFGYRDETQKLLQYFSGAQHQIYADGFSNHVDSDIGLFDPSTEVYYFDNLPIHPLEYNGVARLVESVSIFKYWSDFGKNIIRQNVDLNNDIDNYVVIYLRYWGSWNYEKFTIDNIVDLLIATLGQQEICASTIIVKSDPRIKPDIYPAVVEGLLRAGINVLRFEDYLKLFNIEDGNGLISAEAFFAKGLLCQAKMHFVLDSTLGYSIALNPAFRRPTKIIFGANQNEIDKWAPCQGTRWLKSQSLAYANAVLASKSVGVVMRRGSADVMPQVIELLENIDS